MAPLGAPLLGTRFEPLVVSTGGGGGGGFRRLEVMATTAVKAVCDHFETISCCQMTTQKNPAAKTIHQIWKSLRRAIVHSRARVAAAQPVQSA